MTDVSSRSKSGVLALLALTQFVVVIDGSIVNVALPTIGRALEIGQPQLGWVVNGYLLTFGGFLLLGGRLADLLGRRRIFMAGIALFTVASLLGGLAQNPEWLIAARAVQGLGAALASPAALSIITTTFIEDRERHRALAVWGAVAGAGGAAGVLLGGVLTQFLGWQWVLFVNVPIGAFVLWQSPLRLQPARPTDAGTGLRRYDLPGAALVTAAAALLVYTVVTTPTTAGPRSRRCCGPRRWQCCSSRSCSSSAGPGSRSSRCRSSASAPSAARTSSDC